MFVPVSTFQTFETLSELQQFCYLFYCPLDATPTSYLVNVFYRRLPQENGGGLNFPDWREASATNLVFRI